MYMKYFTSNVTFIKICCRAYVDSIFAITYECNKLNFEGQSGSFLPETYMKKNIEIRYTINFSLTKSFSNQLWQHFKWRILLALSKSLPMN